LYTIANLNRLWVEFDAYESDLPWLEEGQKVSFTTISFPGEKFEGTISFIDPILNQKTRTVKVRAVVDNKDGHLKPDMFVSGTVQATINAEGLVTGGTNLAGKWVCPMHPEVIQDHPGNCDICGMKLKRAEDLGLVEKRSDDKPLLIPASAPLITGKRAIVYVQLPDKEKPTFEGREVMLGSRVGNFIVVKEGLNEGEQVVVNGAFKIDSELEIQAKPSMMNPGDEPMTMNDEHDHQPLTKGVAVISGTPNKGVISDKAMAALEPLYQTYLDLQENLAGDEFDKARAAVAKLADLTGQIKMELFEGEDHMVWMKQSSTIKENAKAAAESKDIAQLRERFKLISDAVITMAKKFGYIGDNDTYVTFCPMAFDNTGAFWIQRDTVINNAYFGSKMLRCGSIKDTLTASHGAN
jgi:Cu(I)/Ag(I) efflux system membrane fusion protein